MGVESDDNSVANNQGTSHSIHYGLKKTRSTDELKPLGQSLLASQGYTVQKLLEYVTTLGIHSINQSRLRLFKSFRANQIEQTIFSNSTCFGA